MKFNRTTSTDEQRTTNFEGAEAYQPESPELGLYKTVVNNLLEDSFYESDEARLHKLARRVTVAADEDPEFVLKLAAYARTELYLRDVSNLLLVFAAQHEEAKSYVREYAPRVIQRADELNTVTAMQLELFGKPIPKPLKKGLADSFHEFDRYQFAKYDNHNREVTFRDVMNLVHPAPETAEEDEIFERLVLGDLDDHPDVEPLDPPETWEVVISEQGNTPEAWREVLPKMGLFATVRNLRNMLDAGLDGEEILTEDDLEYARDSMLYPFRFYQAYEAVTAAGVADEHTERWLSRAVDATATNLPDDLGNTFVAVDLSGSMNSALSGRSEMTYREIASFFGAVLQAQDADVGVFASDFETVSAHTDTPTLERARKIRDRSVGGATNAWLAFEHLVEESAEYDRVVVLTDMQVWDSTWGSDESVREWFTRYRDQVAPGSNLYMVDLQAYGDLVTPEGYDGVYNISGWTADIVEFVVYAEREDEILDEIRDY
ncbi:TROVE domain-containing protein [Haloarchaeobius amylolyticus]|uniref:TROVE domain-containing protein n=1 Tax=Haloarchaeobius amylolyticus TaxID=1198296 RepID=UPI00226ECD62|nr:TROVE domain-containing protein [Haloarchaeobius amylolyticus]